MACAYTSSFKGQDILEDGRWGGGGDNCMRAYIANFHFSANKCISGQNQFYGSILH